MTTARPSAQMLYTTWPDVERARQAAETLLEQRLIACANILGQSQSLYHWEGRIQNEPEIIALFKTTQALSPRVRDALMTLHPYEEPCILALPVQSEASAPGFLQWLSRETLPPQI